MSTTTFEEAFDPTGALARVDGDEELLRDLAAVLRDDWLRGREAIAAALLRHDAPSVAAAAHGLRGSFAQVSGGSAVAGIAQLEREAAAGDLSAATATWCELAPVLADYVAGHERWAEAREAI